ncbi:MAG: hypothetical protein U9P49_11745 [Thermodesulfobacteriota bacterium]|nr:hypothetical protein [Thermodesulfobacteriota bacterium]
MEIPFPFEPFIVFGYLAIFLLAGVFLRARLKFFQHFLIPSCLIGGILGLILISTDVIHLPTSLLETLAYHFFNISFISVGLTYTGGEKKTAGGGKDLVKGPLWMALIEGVTISTQAIIGGLFVILLGIFGLKLFPTFGFLAPLGFTEGPGQALSIGKVWEGFGFAHAATIGLTFAAIGFLFAFFVGVPIVNHGIRKGRATQTPRGLSQDFLAGIIPKDQEKEPAGKLTMHSGNIDTLAFHVALVGLVYILTYALVAGMGRIMSPEIAKMLWGFFFFFGMVIALIVRWFMGKIGIVHLIDPGLQRRITGWAVDFLIVSTVTAVQMVVVWEYILPISLIAITNGIITTLVVVYFGDRIWSYNLERTVAIYGTVTGTVSSGLLLLRIADPEFKTTVAVELGLMLIFIAPIILGSMLLVSAPVLWGWSLGLTLAIFFGILVLSLILMKAFRLWGPRRS